MTEFFIGTAIVLAVGSGVFAWWRTRTDTNADRGDAERDADDGPGPRSMEEILREELREVGPVIGRIRDRLDAFEQRGPVEVSGLREDVDELQVWAEELLRAHNRAAEAIETLQGRTDGAPPTSDPFERMLLMPPRWRDLSTKYAETEGRVALYKTEGLFYPDDFRTIHEAVKDAIHPEARPKTPDPLNGYLQVHVPEPVDWPQGVEVEGGGTLTWTGLDRPAVEKRKVSGASGTDAGDV